MKNGNKQRGRPSLRACEYVNIEVSLPKWLALECAESFIKKGDSSRKKLVERLVYQDMGYTKESYDLRNKNERS